jgi:hypothetical protein
VAAHYLLAGVFIDDADAVGQAGELPGALMQGGVTAAANGDQVGVVVDKGVFAAAHLPVQNVMTVQAADTAADLTADRRKDVHDGWPFLRFI